MTWRIILMRFPRVLLIPAALWLLVSAAPAQADGGWILWSQGWAMGKYKQSLPDTWTAVMKADSSGPCYQARQARTNQVLATGAFRQAGSLLVSDATRSVDYRAFLNSRVIDDATSQAWARQDRESGPLTIYLSFTCLPDTVDPRGARAK